MNTFLPILLLSVSLSLHQTKLSLYLAEIRQTISQIEMQNILKMIPQALFFIDDANEEVLH